MPKTHIDDETDFVDEIIAERSTTNPAFPAMVEEAYQRRLLLRQIAKASSKASRITRQCAWSVLSSRQGAA